MKLPNAARLRELLRFAFASVAFWTLFQSYSATLGWLYTRTLTPIEIVTLFTGRTLVWASFTPLMVMLVERLRIIAPHRLRNGMVLVAAVPLFATTAAVIDAIVRVQFGRATWSFWRRVIEVTLNPNILMTLFALLTLHVVVARRQAAERERRQLELEATMAAMQAEQIRERFRPHDLQEVLAAVSEHAEDNVSHARTLLNGLADVLRMAMMLDAKEQVRLQDELDFLDRYTALRPRAASLLINADEQALAVLVPPRLVPSFVEPVLDSAAGSVQLSATVQDDLQLSASAVMADGSRIASELRVPVRSAAAP